MVVIHQLIMSGGHHPPSWLSKEAILLGWYLTYGLLWIIPAALMTVVCWDSVFQPGAMDGSWMGDGSWMCHGPWAAVDWEEKILISDGTALPRSFQLLLDISVPGISILYCI